MIRAFGILKKSTAQPNVKLGKSRGGYRCVDLYSEEVVSGSLDSHFLADLANWFRNANEYECK